MKVIKECSFFLVVFCLLSLGCKEDSDCNCQPTEICMYDALTATNECLPRGWVVQLGGELIIGPGLYVGVDLQSDCIDTLVFMHHNLNNFSEFCLFVENGPGRVLDIISDLFYEIAPNEYVTSTAAPLCYLNGDALYANLRFIVAPDSVWMKLKYWTLDGDPEGIVDSSIVIFHKNE